MREVHIWTISLAESAAASPGRELLSADELARAARFLAERDRLRFIACRTSLRRILAGLLDAHPAEINFQYSEFGKPSLIGDCSRDFQFNLSHSGDFALIAIDSQSSVGVDIECMRPEIDVNGIAEKFFSVSERNELAALPANQKIEAFFRCWTRKEAIIKAIGEGLSFPLDRFDVTLAPDEPPKLLAVRGGSIAADCWSLHDLPAPPGYIAALAAAGPVDRIVPRCDFI